MTCPACGRAVPPAFPGAKVTCACGRSVDVVAPPPDAAPAVSPYRSSRRIASEPAPERRSRPEPVDSPCPTCNITLDRTEGNLSECTQCTGKFVPKDDLAELLCRAEAEGRGRGGSRPSYVRSTRSIHDEVKYVKCPFCRERMNRVQLGRASGIILDVCRAHGTWFGAGELAQATSFAASGGLERSRALDGADHRQRKEADGRERDRNQKEFLKVWADEKVDERIGLWRELVDVMFW